MVVQKGKRKGVDRFLFYADKQNEMWTKARMLMEESGYDEPIDVIIEALEIYREHIQKGEEVK